MSWPGAQGRRYWVSFRSWWLPAAGIAGWPVAALLWFFWIMALGVWVIIWTVIEAWFLLVSGTWLLVRHMRGEVLNVRAEPFLCWYVLDS